MAKGSLNFFELHFEKILVGIAAVALIYLGWTYLISSPNTVEHNGKQIAAGQVNDEILAEAQELKLATDRQHAPPNAAAPVKYSEIRSEDHTSELQSPCN